MALLLVLCCPAAVAAADSTAVAAAATAAADASAKPIKSTVVFLQAEHKYPFGSSSQPRIQPPVSLVLVVDAAVSVAVAATAVVSAAATAATAVLRLLHYQSSWDTADSLTATQRPTPRGSIRWRERGSTGPRWWLMLLLRLLRLPLLLRLYLLCS